MYIKKPIWLQFIFEIYIYIYKTIWLQCIFLKNIKKQYGHLLVLVGCDGDELRLREVEAAYPLLLSVRRHLDHVQARLVLVQRVEHDLEHAHVRG